LPNYRGLEVFFWALANGERESGVSVFYITEKIDAGKVIMQEKFTIDHDETVKSIYKKLTKICAKLMSQTLHKISKRESFNEHPQIGKGSYYPMPTRKAYKKFKQSGKRWK
jgi:methionyl-tRNA formyltransferase